MTGTNYFFPTIRDFDRLLDDMLPGLARWGNVLERSPLSNAPATDYYEDDNHYYLRVELPGVKREDVSLEFEGDALNLSATRSGKQEGGESTYTFQRTISMPDGVDLDRIKAEFRDGLLTVTLPKGEANKPRRIQVN